MSNCLGPVQMLGSELFGPTFYCGLPTKQLRYEVCTISDTCLYYVMFMSRAFHMSRDIVFA